MKTLRRIRRIIGGLAVLLLVLAIIALSNIWVQNPTGLRYSSEVVDLTLSGQEKGAQAEDILMRDLGLSLTNERSQQETICFCNPRYQTTAPPAQCTVCEVYDENISSWRIPDVVTPQFIGESKNAGALYIRDRSYAQVRDYAMIARLTDRPLWLYVRVDSRVDPEYRQLARATGGDVVYYFRTDEDYQDVVGRVSWGVVHIAGITLLVIISWGYIERRYLFWRSQRSPAPRPTPDPTRAAVRSVDDTQAYMQSAERQSKDTLDS